MSKLKKNHFISLQGTRVVPRGKNTYTIRNHRDRFFFPDEWKAFYDSLLDSQKPTFEFLINTGARIMEVQNIKVGDIDFDRHNIVLRITKRIVNRPGIQKKGVRKIRVINVSSKFAKYMNRLVNKHNLKADDFFPILSTPAANVAMKKALVKAGIVDWKMFSLHNVRKTLETWLIALNVDHFKVVNHFGHSAAIALKHYVSPDIFSFEDKTQMREIVGDILQ